MESSSLFKKLGAALYATCSMDARPLMATYEHRYLRALSRAISADTPFVSKPYDCLLVTGDLSATGSTEDLGVAKSFLTGKRVSGAGGKIGRAALEFPRDRIVILPGNHDRYFGRWLRPISKLFEHSDHFGEQWTVDKPTHSEERTNVSEYILPSNGFDKLAIVSADFSFSKTPVLIHKWWGNGKALPNVIEDMKSVTGQLRNEGIAVVWAMHFCPDPTRVKWYLRLENGKSVVDAARDSEIPVIFCGHTHESKTSEQAVPVDRFSGIDLRDAGSACGFGPGERSFLHIEIEVNAGKARVKTLKMIYAERTQREFESGKIKKLGEFVPHVKAKKGLRLIRRHLSEPI